MGKSDIIVYKDTSDEWYGNYCIVGEPGTALVCVSLLQLDDGQWRVCAWGNDDCGVERDFLDRDQALAVFLEVITPNTVTMDDFIKRGFISA